MSAIARDDEKLRELDAGTIHAWQEYRARTRGLRGEEYERAEEESWAELQGTLSRLAHRRQLLNCSAA